MTSSEDIYKPPLTKQDTINIADGSKLELSQVVPERETTLLIVSNTSTGGQVIYRGTGQPAIAGINPIGQGQQWVEAIDSEARPSNADLNLLVTADGATVSIERRTRNRVTKV